MLLSDWYAKWKENRIQAAVEKARAEAYEKGYAAGRSENPDITGNTVTREARTSVTSRGKKSHTEKEK